MKRLVIDIPALMESGVSAEKIQCEYMFHRKNEGSFSLLERQKDGLIKRYNMRCVGCKSCVLACPFGTILPEVINYVTAKCDNCLQQLSDNPDYIPACVKTAPADTFSMKELNKEDKENHLYFVGDYIAVKSPGWRQKEGRT